jgi:hypothetical protein
VNQQAVCVVGVFHHSGAASLGFAAAAAIANFPTFFGEGVVT